MKSLQGWGGYNKVRALFTTRLAILCIRHVSLTCPSLVIVRQAFGVHIMIRSQDGLLLLLLLRSGMWRCKCMSSDSPIWVQAGGLIDRETDRLRDTPRDRLRQQIERQTDRETDEETD